MQQMIAILLDGTMWRVETVNWDISASAGKKQEGHDPQKRVGSARDKQIWPGLGIMGDASISTNAVSSCDLTCNEMMKCF